MSNTHGPIPKQWRALLNDIAHALDEGFNGVLKEGEARTHGFILLLFPFGEPDDNSRISYISNGNREDCIVALKEWIARAEGRHVEPPPGSKQ